MTNQADPAALTDKAKLASRKKLEAAVWKNKHRDFKGTIDGVRSILHLNPKTGGSELCQLSWFSSEELLQKLPAAVRATWTP